MLLNKLFSFPRARSEEPAVSPSSTDMVLQVKSLSVSIGNAPVVNGVSFAVRKGEVACLVGESGSGKTLSALAVMGLLPEAARVSGGSVQFCGQDVTALSEKAWRSLRGVRIGMIFQEPMTSLNPVMTVGKQIAEVFETHTDFSSSEICGRVIELLKQVKIDDPERRFNAYPFELSGGQRQRVMIAMALAMQPDLLIADEPTTALDVTVQKEILSLINELRKDLGMGVLFVTHDFGVVRQMADHVVVMHKGKVVEQGRVGDVMANPQHPYTQKLLAAMPKLVLHKARQGEGDDGPLSVKMQGVGDAPLLEVRNLSKHFMVKRGGVFGKKERFDALKNVSFSLQAGETLGVVGESGCGKSTLSRCLVKLYAADGGRVVFNGTDMVGLEGEALRQARKQMQMVFQDPFSSLNPRMKVGDIVAEGLLAHKVMQPSERKEYVHQLLADCGLPTDAADRYPHQFSGGQRQRIGIARALALKPALVIADEPVSALDVSVQRQILDLLQDLKQKYGLSYLFISHDLRVVSELSDRVIVMHGGEIVEQGVTTEVFAHPQHPYTRKLLAALPE